MKPDLYVMVGLPRSGKSTHARSLGMPIVSKDSIRLALHGKRFLTEAEPWVKVIAKTMVKALFASGHEQVVVDECNITRKHREEWMSDDWDTTFVEMDTVAEECLSRAADESDHEIIDVIVRMIDAYEPVHQCQEE